MVGVMSAVTEDAIRSALATVNDPEIGKPITDLGMVKSVAVQADSSVDVEVYLTTSACPMRTQIVDRVQTAVADVPGTGEVRVELDVMNDEQRAELRKTVRGDKAEPVIPFAQPGSLTRATQPSTTPRARGFVNRKSMKRVSSRSKSSSPSTHAVDTDASRTAFIA